MSHAQGAVKFDDGLVMFYEYDGTADVVLPKLRKTMEEVETHWRKGEYWEASYACTHAPEHVVIATNYGFGSSWHGTACRICETVIDSGLDQYGSPVDKLHQRELPLWFYGSINTEGHLVLLELPEGRGGEDES